MAAGATYEPIATTTLGSATGTVTFTSISQSYTDLVLMCAGQNATGDGQNGNVTFNGDTGANYSLTQISGSAPSNVYSARTTNGNAIYLGYNQAWTTTANSPGIYYVNIMNYSNTTTYKTLLERAGYASGTYRGTEAIVGLWRNTNAITSISIVVNASGTFAAGSTFTLYGIKAA